MQHTVYIALGSNLGDRAGALQRAWRKLGEFSRLDGASFLYESPPAYVLDQPAFLNAVCRVTTDLPPHALLARLKAIEEEMGRQKTVRFGPRQIDLDILLYDDVRLDQDGLTIPHPRMLERDFVLQPLADIAGGLRHPDANATIDNLWQALNAEPLPRVMPIAGQIWRWSQKTFVMGILNLTPDSFSGDGLLDHDEIPVERIVERGRQLVRAGADVLDVGGLSTRPGHGLIPVEEEIRRIEPGISALSRELSVPISVDAFRAPVAQAALRAGAHMINDIWGLQFDPSLADIAADHNVPLVVMHNRLPPTDASYPAHLRRLARIADTADVVAEVCAGLRQSLDIATAAPIPLWHQIVDPGMGFGKSVDQHLQLIQRLGEIVDLGYPLLFGPSRKGFIGKALGGLPPGERLEGTLAACTLAVERGANIVRVHDVEAASRVVRFVNAVRRA